VKNNPPNCAEASAQIDFLLKTIGYMPVIRNFRVTELWPNKRELNKVELARISG